MEINRLDGLVTVAVPQAEIDITGRKGFRPGPELDNSSARPDANLTPETTAAKDQEREIDDKALRAEVEKVNKVVELFQKELKFVTHSSSHRRMVEVINRETEEVIKEIPPKEFLDWVGKFQDLLGMMVDTTV